MSDKQTGGPAFPKINYIGDEPVYGSDGMTLRDYFAAKAMQGMLAEDSNYTFENVSKAAYKVADAMLEARKS